jgi:DNA-binding CsgD family transcriptional regulator
VERQARADILSSRQPIRAVECRVARLEWFLSATLDRPGMSYADAALLSPRQREVLALVSQGLTSKQIGERLGTSRATVESQVRWAMLKLGARNRLHAIALAASADPLLPAPGTCAVLDPEQRRLVDLLARGVPLSRAAASLYLSRRSADRRLAAVRRALGVETTAEAVRLLGRVA